MKKTYISPSTDVALTICNTVLAGSLQVTIDGEELTDGGDGSLDNAQSRQQRTVWDDEEEDLY